MPILNIYKRIGETPLECLERNRKENIPMTYAGRLDPLAEGVLIVLSGDDVKRKEEFLSLSKTYQVSILFGFSTDTGDLLGLVKGSDFDHQINIEEVKRELNSLIGLRKMKYPAFSSKTIKGKPLFFWKKKGELQDEEIPEREVEIKSIKYLGERNISSEELLSYITNVLSKVRGDFRQEECLKNWKEILINKKNFKLIDLELEVSSGTYMRVLAEEIGKSFNIPSLAFHIKRISVGDYSISNSIGQ